MDFNSLRDEEIIVGFVAILTAFVWLNVSQNVGSFYTVGVFFYLVPLLARRKDWVVPITTKKPSLKAGLAIGGVILGIWLVSASFIISGLTQSAVSFESFFTRMSAYTQVPVLGNDPNMNFITFGNAIPVIETLIFLSFTLKLLLKVFKLDLRWQKIGGPGFMKMVWICIVIAAAGSLFHMTVRMMADTALFIDFGFFFISTLIVFRFGRLWEAMWFHILVNSGVILLGG
jgi:hypothetical protein